MATPDDPNTTGGSLPRQQYRVHGLYQSLVMDGSKMTTLTRELKYWARSHLKISYSDTNEDVDNNDVSLLEFMKKYAPNHVTEIFSGLLTAPLKQPDEDADAYERRLILWQAEKDSRRAEAKKAKQAVLNTVIAAVLLSFVDVWGVGILCFLGFDHPGIVWPGILTGLALVAVAAALWAKHSSMQVPE